MDIAILALPVKEVWKLQMNTRTKMEVSGLFLLGGLFVVIFSLVPHLFPRLAQRNFSC